MELFVFLVLLILFGVLILRARRAAVSDPEPRKDIGVFGAELNEEPCDSSTPREVKYDFDVWNNRYWLCPEYSGEGEVFLEMPTWLSRLIKRDQIFQFLDDDTVIHSMLNKAYFVSTVFYLDFCSWDYESIYMDHESVNVYLVRAERNGQEFYKIGLTLEQDPLKRDKKVYKEVVSCVSVKGGARFLNESLPELYERYLLWKCWMSDEISHISMDPVKFKGWAGRSEIVQTTDVAVKNIFDQGCDELCKGLELFGPLDIYAELSMLCLAIKACWDDEHLYSGHAVAEAVLPIEHVSGTSPSKVVPGLDIGLSPEDIRTVQRFMIAKLAPYVERVWDMSGTRDRKTRYELSNKLSNAHYARRGGPHGRKWGINRSKYGNDRYCYNRHLYLIDYEENKDKSYL